MLWYTTQHKEEKEVPALYFDRAALKRRAKHLVGQGTPPAYLVTLVFLAATTAVSTVVNLVLPNPLNQVETVWMDWFNTVMESGGELSQGSMDVLSQRFLSLFQGPMASVAMLVALIVGFYSMVVSLGYQGYALRVMRGQEGGGFDTLFSQFYLAGKVILLAILKFLFTYLWSLLFVIPGIVASYRYRMAEYALLDEPEISPLEAIRRSKVLMRGRKMQLFVLDLSFLGWMILAGVAVTVVQMLLEQISLPLVMMNLAAVSTVVTTLVTLVANLAVNMFLTCYMTLADAGFYLFALGNQAPPVGGPNGWDPNGPNGGWNQGGPNNPWGPNGGAPYDEGNEGWNQ